MKDEKIYANSWKPELKETLKKRKDLVERLDLCELFSGKPKYFPEKDIYQLGELYARSPSRYLVLNELKPVEKDIDLMIAEYHESSNDYYNQGAFFDLLAIKHDNGEIFSKELLIRIDDYSLSTILGKPEAKILECYLDNTKLMAKIEITERLPSKKETVLTDPGIVDVLTPRWKKSTKKIVFDHPYHKSKIIENKRK